MIKQKKEILIIAGTRVAIPASDLRKARALVRKGAKIDAIGIIRKHTRIGIKHVKAAIENPKLFEQAPDAKEQSQAASATLTELFQQWRAGDITLQQIIHSNPRRTIAAVATMLVLSLSIVTAAAWDSPKTSTPWLWYYDLNTDELFESKQPLPPIDAPSGEFEGGAGGVRAYLFACGSCDGPDDPEIGYLETFAQSATDLHAQIEAGETITIDEETLWETISSGHQIKRIHDPRWASYHSAAGEAIRTEAIGRCDDKAVVSCFPH